MSQQGRTRDRGVGRTGYGRALVAGKVLVPILITFMALAPVSRADPLIQQGPRIDINERVPEYADGVSGGIALSADGTTALIGAPSSDYSTGAAWVLTHVNGAWQVEAELNPDEDEGGFGTSAALSSDGNTAIVGSVWNGAYVFTRVGGIWHQQAKLIGEGRVSGAPFGEHVALSGDGDTALVGDGTMRGAAWVFVRSGNAWMEQGPKLSGEEEVGESKGGLEAFGASVALSADGSTALIGGEADDGAKGAVWAFSRSGGVWSQDGPKLIGGDEQGEGWFGRAVALSGDGLVALVGGPGDDETDGGAWIFKRSQSEWVQQGEKLTSRFDFERRFFGASVSLSADGTTAIIGGPGNHGYEGAAWVFRRSNETWPDIGVAVKAQDVVEQGEFGLMTAASFDGDTAVFSGRQAGRGDGEEFGQPGALWFFAAQPTAPSAVTDEASAVQQEQAYLTGRVNPNGKATSCQFDYGPTAAVGSTVPCAEAPGSGEQGAGANGLVTGLSPGTTYYFRLVATNSAGTTVGNLQTLTTSTPVLPEVGRCIKRTAGTGEYQDAKCTTVGVPAGTGRYEWRPWPAPRGEFAGSGGKAVFETVGKVKIVCRSTAVQGGYAASQEMFLIMSFFGCEEGGEPCQTEESAPGEINTTPLRGQLGVISGGKEPTIGVAVTPYVRNYIAMFGCPGREISMNGSVIATLTPIDKMTSRQILKFKATRGLQSPAGFEEGPPNKLSFDLGQSEEEQGALKFTETLATTQEALEVKAVQ
jgi:hypothetical protein